MCVTSVILDYGRLQSPFTWTPPNWREYQDLLEKARKWDELSSQPHCEDPEKEIWMKEVDDRLKKLEKECECGGQNCGPTYKTTKDEK